MLSVILLSYYSGQRIITVYEKLTTVLGTAKIDFELIVIDDGSKDNSYQIALELEKKYSNVRAYQLSKNYTSHYAIFAGLSVCRGQCATPIPDDEQQPYDLLVEMYRLWQQGKKVIIPHRISRSDGFFNDFLSNLYYNIMNHLTDVQFPKGGADTFFIDREVIDVINERIRPINTSCIIEVLRLGYDPYPLPYARLKGSNHKSRWTFRKKMKLFKDTFISSSTWPIRIIRNLGLFLSLIAFVIIVFYSYIRIFGNTQFWGEHLPGWTSTVVIISFFCGMILFSLGVIAEYIWLIYEEVKNRPGYLIKKK